MTKAEKSRNIYVILANPLFFSKIRECSLCLLNYRTPSLFEKTDMKRKMHIKRGVKFVAE